MKTITAAYTKFLTVPLPSLRGGWTHQRNI